MAELSSQAAAPSLASADRLPGLVGGNFRAVPLSLIPYKDSAGDFNIGTLLKWGTGPAGSRSFLADAFAFGNYAGTQAWVTIGAGGIATPGLNVTGDVATTGNTAFGTSTNTGTNAFGGSMTIARTGSATVPSLSLIGSARNWINFNGTTGAAPAFTTRSAGAKLVLYPLIDGSHTDYAIGVDTNATWFGVPTTSEAFKFYGGTTLAATLTGAGALTLVGSLSVPVGANLATSSGNVGVGTANPLAKLVVSNAAAEGVEIVPGTTANTSLVQFYNRNAGAYDAARYSASSHSFYISGAASVSINASGHILPAADNAQDLGSASFRARTLYAGTGTINTSDEREKEQIGRIPDEWLDAWGEVEWCRFKFRDAVAEKGDAARWHIGAVAQRVRDVFKSRGLDALAIGLLCYDKWERTTEPVYEEVTKTRKVAREMQVPYGRANKEGVRKTKAKMVEVPEEYPAWVDTGETRVVQEAGDRWGLRYDECFAIEAAWQRRRIAAIEERLEKAGLA
ncbi:MAG: hypothetical protein QOH47_2429 [Sphingomonadales bacterium]|jgi:hypothetical protein|nr:hypothetical protein [Sphingomonadales bacterium]